MAPRELTNEGVDMFIKIRELQEYLVSLSFHRLLFDLMIKLYSVLNRKVVEHKHYQVTVLEISMCLKSSSLSFLTGYCLWRYTLFLTLTPN